MVSVLIVQKSFILNSTKVIEVPLHLPLLNILGGCAMLGHARKLLPRPNDPKSDPPYVLWLWKHHLGSVSPVTFPGMSVTSENILPNNLDGGFS